MNLATVRPRPQYSEPPFTCIAGGAEGFYLASILFVEVEREMIGSGDELIERIDASPASGVALDLSGVGVPTAERTEAVTRFVDGLQARGTNVVLHGVPADFLTALLMDGEGGHVPTQENLTEAVATLRAYHRMRLRCLSDRGQRLNQLRMPLHSLSFAPLCAHARARLESAGVDPRTGLELLREVREQMVAVLDLAQDPELDISLAVTVHEGRATLTLLDSGPARPSEAGIPPEGAHVDRYHRFRILDRHNALVLEKDLEAGR